jgi:hypothetical protein
MAVVLANRLRYRRVTVEPGRYQHVTGADPTTRAAAAEVRSLNIDRERALAIVTFAGGTTLAVPFTSRPRDQWPLGCPTNLLNSYMEVLDLTRPLSIATLTLADPVLVAQCGRDVPTILLCEKGPVGYVMSGWGGRCLVFTP